MTEERAVRRKIGQCDGRDGQSEGREGQREERAM